MQKTCRGGRRIPGASLRSIRTNPWFPSGISYPRRTYLHAGRPGDKEAGRSFFQVDLLVPSATDDILKYLLAESQESMILAREGCCMVRLPAPERFAVHKLLVSQLRKQRGEKSMKDVSRASVRFAILAERHPRAIDALDAVLRK